MTSEESDQELKTWVDRTRRMAEYQDEALDFLRRAGEQVPVLESDLGIVCHLWALADEHDQIMCRALTEFDSALFETDGELDVTRGVEIRPAPDSESQVLFLCTWSIARGGQRRISCVLYGEQFTGVVGLEIQDSGGVGRPLPFPLRESSALYEALSDAFFRLAAKF